MRKLRRFSVQRPGVLKSYSILSALLQVIPELFTHDHTNKHEAELLLDEKRTCKKKTASMLASSRACLLSVKFNSNYYEIVVSETMILTPVASLHAPSLSFVQPMLLPTHLS